MRFKVTFILLIGFVLSLALLGGRLRSPMVGEMLSVSLAHDAGFRSGDEILRIGDFETTSWESFCFQWSKLKGQSAEVVIRRSGEEIKISLPKVPDTSPSEFGLKPFFAPAALVLKVSSPLRNLGVLDGDQVKAFNGVPISGFRHFLDVLAAQKPGAPLNIDLVRNESGQTLAIGVPALDGNEVHSMETLGLIQPLFVVKATKMGSIAAKLGIRENDRLVLIQGQAADFNFKVDKFSSALKNERVLKLAVVRGDKVQHLEMKVEGISPPEEGDFWNFLKFMGVSPLSEARAQSRLANSFEELRVALLFHLIGRE
jgi:membrane-associated protease RseP (regulator of RpoE activity)